MNFNVHSDIIRKDYSLKSEEKVEGSPEVTTFLSPTEKDVAWLRENDDPPARVDDHYDYSNVVVRKPWGYEYLITQNAYVAVWVLYIKPGEKTSFHCHPNKKTSLIILSGEAMCSFAEQDVRVSSAQGLIIGEGVFHRTSALSEGGIFLMEIESPVNKRDLVRYLDSYGRQNQGYESKEFFTFNTENYNYISLIDSSAYYNVKKRYGNCSIELVKIANQSSLREQIYAGDWDILALMKGSIADGSNNTLYGVADSVSRRVLLSLGDLNVASELEVILVRKIDTKSRFSDLVVSELEKHDAKTVFLVPEAVNAHMVDSIARNTDMNAVSLRTEMGATVAAEGYAKLTGKPGVVVVSSGGSGVKALSGVANAFIDSTPLLIISGQSRSSGFGEPHSDSLRQLASKELDIISLAKSISCKAVTLKSAEEGRQQIAECFSSISAGRPSPAWLDIPFDLLAKEIDESAFESLEPLKPQKSKLELSCTDLEKTRIALSNAKRPVILAGHGIRIAGAVSLLKDVALKSQIPVLTSRRGIDLLDDEFSMYFGRPGTYGQRSANFIIQNCDLLISIGSRLSMPLVGRNFEAFARHAQKIVVDIDEAEINKPTLKVDIKINVSAEVFLSSFYKLLPQEPPLNYKPWLETCREWRNHYPVENEGYESEQAGVNPYLFIGVFSEFLHDTATLVVDGGSCLDYVMQTFKVKQGTRIISSPGLESQGFAVPASIGACVGQSGQRVYCVCDRKGLELSAAELETISANNLPITIILLNSLGDPETQRVQTDYFGSRFVGSSEYRSSSYLNAAAVGAFSNIPVYGIQLAEDMGKKLPEFLALEGPVLLDIHLPAQFEMKPRLQHSVMKGGHWVSRPLEDMYPYLPRAELQETMLIPLLDKGFYDN